MKNSNHVFEQLNSQPNNNNNNKNFQTSLHIFTWSGNLWRWSFRENIEYWESVTVQPLHWRIGHINYIVKQMKINSGYQQEEIFRTEILDWPRKMTMKQAGEISSGWSSCVDNSNGRREWVARGGQITHWETW